MGNKICFYEETWLIISIIPVTLLIGALLYMQSNKEDSDQHAQLCRTRIFLAKSMDLEVCLKRQGKTEKCTWNCWLISPFRYFSNCIAPLSNILHYQLLKESSS